MIGVTGSGNLNTVSISLVGDGTSFAVVVDFTKAPFSLSFGDNLPVSLLGTMSNSGQVTLNNDHSSIIVSFPSALGIAGSSGTLTFVYTGE